jgi:Tfp pilus assembly protein PilF
VWSYLRASQIEPTNSIPIERVGFLHLREDLFQAEIIFESLMASHPEAPAGHHGMAMVLLSRGETQGAEESFKHALQLAPDAVPAIAGLGVVYDAQGRHAAAQAQYVAALERAPRDAEVLNNLGLSYLSTEQFDEAEGAFRRAVRLRPSSETFHNNLGLALGRQDRYEDALREFSNGGTEAGAENNLGYVYFLNGRYAEAIARYEQALGLGSAEPLAVVQNLRDAREALDLETSALDAQAPVFRPYPEDQTELLQ